MLDHNQFPFDETEALLNKRWETLGYERLLPEERDFIVVWWLNAEVQNGTFDQYFRNSSGNDALHALAALERIGAPRTHKALKRALEVFGVDGFSIVGEDRLYYLQNHFDTFDNPFAEAMAEWEASEDEPIQGKSLSKVREAYLRAEIAGD